MNTERLGPQATEVLDRTRGITFTWNGTGHRGFQGDTIVSALLAANQTVFSRSFKYHRPRSVMVAGFLDPGCTVQVGSEPNVRGAHRLLAEGMQITAQNVRPSLEFDVGAANDFIGRFLTAGFYYKTFMSPRVLWPWYNRILSTFAGGGKVGSDHDSDRYDKRFAHPDVIVAGGGLAGMAAAVAAANTGSSVMLVEEEYELGGMLRYDPAAIPALRRHRQAVEQAGVEILTNAVVTGRYDDNWVAIAQRQVGDVPERLIKARAGVLIVAPGLIERPYVFAGNDKPGVMLSTGVRRLINLWAIKPGTTAVVLSANRSGEAAAADLQRAGVTVARVVDPTAGVTVVRASGPKRAVERVELSDGSRIECDLLVTATGWTAPTSLLNMSGDRPAYRPDAARYFTSSLPDSVMVTGAIAGDGNDDQLVAHAEATGLEAARRAAVARRALQRARVWAAPVVGPEPAEASIPIPTLPIEAHPALFEAGTSGIVDFCEDVKSQDLRAAVREGYDSIELMKRYTTVTMGPTQGKLETVNAAAILSDEKGVPIESIGTTVWRPPYAPISLGALGGRRFEATRLSPMQPWHDRHGAVPLVAGQWMRPDHYGDPLAEVRNVRENVGVIDVTPLGKLDLRGRDVPKLLNLVYVNRWNRLEIGSVRYGVMCAEDGVIFDDGVTGRLAEDRFLMTTTSSGAATVWEWIENWLQTEHPEWDVSVVPVTTAYASMNVAGPKARTLVERLVENLDLSAEGFPYMTVRTGRVAGVENCFMWRIGFTGELSYEIHVPAGYGLHVWETLFQEGADLGIGAFGIEAQRVMRLEKGHFIVGQDTDGLTQGYGAGLDWLIKLDKEDFAGRTELIWQSERDDYQRLVAVQPVNPSQTPPEASQIVEGSQIVGRITSSRFSPSLQRSIALAMVAPRLALPGTRLTIRQPNGEHVEAEVMGHHAHFDPDGERLRV